MDVYYEEDRLGLKIQSETVEIMRDDKGLVGISIGGGHPFCPCVYVVQVFDGSPTEKDGRIRCGDEVVAINGVSVKGERKSAVAQLIQCSTNPVKITINKLEDDPEKGKTLDILMKKVKHKVVEFMDTDSADALGLSRAILCNDPLLNKIKVLEGNAEFYRNLIGYFNDLLHYEERIGYYQKAIGDVFCELAAHEVQQNANEAFYAFGEIHRQIGKNKENTLKQMTSMLSDLATYSEHVIPDTEATLKKYLDVKYEYLSYCLKLKEMDDEEQEVHQLNENLYRVESGNYEYRLMLRCRQASRQKFVKMRHDVMVKIELLDQKHVRDIAGHLTRYAETMRNCQKLCEEAMNKPTNSQIEIDVSTLTLRESESLKQDRDAEDNVDEEAQEAADLMDVQDRDREDQTINVGDLIDMDNANDEKRQASDASLINFE